ncbi:MAG: GntR family transcriptional regulator [Bacteroidales bacterium]|jgi:predicted RNA-binding protein (virulence factor B family)|nr:S1-like domain-containing RNA-binding protein [Bacteroidales bacterium]MCK9498539.1 S1-like domain-containing RNA-binding protein [Bacteroidales bacterium]MDY0313789.1 S1-like domain-containing RNA-binding protein [Bacteroidales bacterium]NLB86603.1 GntR family transcriptional regulator [Bacteroidales bacterium]
MDILGKNVKLKIAEVKADIIIFETEDFGEIQAENNDLIIKYKKDQEVEVFIYPENENTVKAFIGSAYAQVNEFARLKVVAITQHGVFMDFGLEKDIFCPFAEQKTKMEINKYYTVFIYLDKKTNRLVASAKIEKFISEQVPDLAENDEVSIIIINKSPLGYNAIVENKYQGLLYSNEVFGELKQGETTKAIIKKIREDNKIDLRLFKNDASDISKFEQQIIEYLKKHDGKMNINDKSEPEEIYRTFGISKKNFKKALGALYRKNIIDLKDRLVKLLDNN